MDEYIPIDERSNEWIAHEIEMNREHGDPHDKSGNTIQLLNIQKQREAEAKAALVDDDSVITDQELTQYVDSILGRWNTEITGQDYVDAAKRHRQKTGASGSSTLDLLQMGMVQGQMESGFGTRAPRSEEGWDPYSNIYNIGVQDDKTTMQFPDRAAGLDAYFDLMYNDYTNQGQIPIEQLLQPGGFVNQRGERYASNREY